MSLRFVESDLLVDGEGAYFGDFFCAPRGKALYVGGLIGGGSLGMVGRGDRRVLAGNDKVLLFLGGAGFIHGVGGG